MRAQGFSRPILASTDVGSDRRTGAASPRALFVRVRQPVYHRDSRSKRHFFPPKKPLLRAGGISRFSGGELSIRWRSE
jgi:hypothetical protein